MGTKARSKPVLIKVLLAADVLFTVFAVRNKHLLLALLVSLLAVFYRFGCGLHEEV